MTTPIWESSTPSRGAVSRLGATKKCVFDVVVAIADLGEWRFLFFFLNDPPPPKIYPLPLPDALPIFPYRPKILLASASLVRSGNVGPEPTIAGSSPGISDRTSVTTRAGAAASASRPPFTPDRCEIGRAHV